MKKVFATVAAAITMMALPVAGYADAHSEVCQWFV